MKKIVFMLCAVFALSLALVGCGAGGNAGTDIKSAWIGYWDLSEMEQDGEVTSSEDISTLKALGLEVYMELKDDGTGSLNLFGESMALTWEASSATAGRLTMEGQSVDLTIEDGKLSMVENGSKMTFVKGEAHTSSSSSATSSSSSSSTESSSSSSASSSSSSAS